MASKFRHIISSVLGAILYFFLQSQDQPKEEKIIHSAVRLIGEHDIDSLKTGKWTIVTDKYNFEDDSIFTNEHQNYGILVVNSMASAKIAALLGFVDPNSSVSIVDGVVNNSSQRNIDRDIPFEKVIDYFVYYWAFGLRKSFKAPMSVPQLLEMFGMSLLNVFLEVGQYLLGMF